MATKKDFIACAAIIHEGLEAGNHDRSLSNSAVCEGIARGMAHEFSKGNPRFNRSKFMAACGFEGC